MRVGVVGACGFLGSHLLDELLVAGDDVVAVDDLSSAWLDEDGNPKFTPVGLVVEVASLSNLSAARASLLDCDVIVNLALRHPVERDLALYESGVREYVSAFADLVVDAIRCRRTRRVVVVGHLDAVDWVKSPVGHLVRAAGEVLGYLHRPPRFDVEVVHLPELYGPRQLPEGGWLAAAMNGTRPSVEPTSFHELGYVRAAARLLAERIHYVAHRSMSRYVVSADVLTAATVATAISELGERVSEGIRVLLQNRVLDVDLGQSEPLRVSSRFDAFLETDLRDALEETIRFYEEVARDE